jgi:hypothetical protein
MAGNRRGTVARIFRSTPSRATHIGRTRSDLEPTNGSDTHADRLRRMPDPFESPRTRFPLSAFAAA